jgi:hypothetical protein
MKYLKYILLLLVGLMIAYSFVATQWSQVMVKPHAEYQETAYYMMDEDGDKVSLTTYQTDLNKGILRLRSDSNLPLKKQIRWLSKILGRVLQDEERGDLRTLYIGRLEYAFGPKNKQMSERLAEAASKSPLWNKRARRPYSGHANDSVKKIANQAMIYPELKEVFKKHKMDLKFSSAEKVLINSDGLPFDCLTWFSIRPGNIHP